MDQIEALGEQRVEFARRIDDLLAASRVGKLARKLRKRGGMGIDQLAHITGIAPEQIDEVEKTDDLSCAAQEAIMHGIMEGEDTEAEASEIIDRYIAALSPSDAEDAALRYDARAAMAALIDDLREACGPPNEPVPKEMEDPWEAAPKSRRVRKQCRKARPAVSATNGLGYQPTAPERDLLRETIVCPEVTPSRRITVQLRMVTKVNGQVTAASQPATLDKEYETIEDIGLTIHEAKSVLSGLQVHMVEQQAAAYVRAHSRCTHCGRQLGVKDHRTIRYQTLFGNLTLKGDRYRRCGCMPGDTKTLTPVAKLLSERTSPEMLFLESKLAALVSYGISAKLLREFLPVDAKLSPSTVWKHAMKVAQRCETTSAEVTSGLTDEVDDGELAPITVGIDGGYLKHWHERTGNFEVIVGKSVAGNGAAKCFGGVHRYDADPKGRLARVLFSQGCRRGTPVRFLSDGERTVRQLQMQMVPWSTHVLDWFHIAMRFTVLKQFIRGLVRIEKDEGSYGFESDGREAQRLLDSAKWKLWHGKVEDALERLDDLSVAIESFENKYPRYGKLQAAIAEIVNYLDRNRDFIINYGEDHRAGRTISTSFIESMVNSLLGKRFSKKQHMQWTPKGAHLLLQLRVQLSNDELWDTFRGWYPKLPPTGAGAQTFPIPERGSSTALRLVA